MYTNNNITYKPTNTHTISITDLLTPKIAFPFHKQSNYEESAQRMTN